MDPEDPPELPEFLTHAEACALLRIGKTTLDRHVSNGLIEKIKLGRRTLFRSSALLRVLENGKKEKT